MLINDGGVGDSMSGESVVGSMDVVSIIMVNNGLGPMKLVEDDVINDGGDNKSAREGAVSIREICMGEGLAGELDDAMIDDSNASEHDGGDGAGVADHSVMFEELERGDLVTIVTSLTPAKHAVIPV